MTALADRHLVLIGLMGSGKTPIGRLAASRLGRPFFDSDAMIEARTGRTVREIWEIDGEPMFRALETEALVEALNNPVPAVIAAAGGVVLSETNRTALRTSNARVVWLRADPKLLVERVKSGGHRPLLDGDAEGTLQTMYDERASLYREIADAIVTVDNRSASEVLEAVLR